MDYKYPVKCSNCSNIFYRPTKATYRGRCEKCTRLFDSMPRIIKKHRVGKKGHIEIVLLPKKPPKFDEKHGDWYMPVWTRKKKSNESYEEDRVWLHLGTKATEEQVKSTHEATMARMELDGAYRNIRSVRLRQAKKKKDKRHTERNWKQGFDKNLGIKRARVSRTVFKVHLSDPKREKKQIFVGTFNTIKEARIARKKKYDELKWQVFPCKVCNQMPTISNHRITHLSSDCPNRVQFPYRTRPLFQSKIWNMQFSTGSFQHLGRVTLEDLYFMGFMSRNKSKGGYRPIAQVEVDTRTHKIYRTLREPRDVDIYFE